MSHPDRDVLIGEMLDQAQADEAEQGASPPPE
jgi:hypothetical protein